MTAPVTSTNGRKPLSVRDKLALRVRQLRRQLRGRPEPVRAAVLPESPFNEWTFADAERAIDDALANQTIDTSSQAGGRIATVNGEANFAAPRGRQDPIAVNRAFYEGDHWQNGSGYIGPHPAPHEAGYNETMQEIGLIFTSQNAVREGTERHTQGCVGKPFRWGLVPRRETGEQEPSPDEQTLIDEATGIVRNWLKARKVPKLIHDAVCTLLLSERSPLRLNIPAGLTEETSAGVTVVNVPAGDVKAALSKIWPEHPSPDSAVVSIDDDTKLEAGVTMYEADADGDGKPEEYAWLSFLNEAAETVIRILGVDDDPKDPATLQSRLSLGGRITMFEMRRPALITPQVQQAQRALNFALTMVPRNVTTGGFLERLILDAQMPGQWELDANGVKTGRWIPNKFYVGAGTTNFIEGAEYETTNDQGEKVIRRGSPSAVFREPVKPDASLTAKDAHYRSILSELGQMHVLISGDATASAVARIQARVEYLNTLLLTAPEVEAALAWIIETALAMAEAIAQTPGKYTNALRADVTLRLDTGPITPEERKAIEESIGKTISQETAMLLLGIDDVDAEKTRMAADRSSQAAFAKVVGDALAALTGAGATLEGAAKFMGLEKEEITNLLTPETSPPPSTTPPAPPSDKTDPPADDADEDTGTKPGSSSGSEPGGE